MARRITAPAHPALRRTCFAALAVLAVGVGAVLRFVAASPMWLDEALSAEIASLGWAEIVDALEHDGHPPLYYWLLKAWSSVFGDTDTALRALSGVIGLATMALTYPLVRRMSSPRVAWTAVVVVAASPFYVRYASEARMYALVMLLVTLGWLAVLWALDSPAVGRLASVSLVVASALWTHYWAFFLVAVVGALLVGRIIRGRRPRAHRRVLIAVAVGVACFVPWVPTFLYQRAHTGTPWAEAARPTVVVAETLIVFSGQAASEPYLLLAVLSMCAVLAFVVVGDERAVQLGGRAPVTAAGTVALATILLGASVSIVAGSAFQGRYAAWVAPFVVVVVASGAARVAPWWTRFGTLALVVALGWLGTLHAIEDDRSQSGDFAEVLNARWQDGDLVVFCPDQLAPATVRYLDEDIGHVTYPLLTPGERVDWVDYVQRHSGVDVDAVADRVTARLGGEGRIWMVTSDSYRVVGEQCSELLAALAPGFTSEQVIRADNVEHFEHGSLLLLSPR